MKYLVKVFKNGTYEVLHETTSTHFPRGGQYALLETSEVFIGKPIVQLIDEVPTLVQDPAIDLQAQVSNLYNEMENEVYDEMKKVFGTRNDASAQAFAATWEAMIKRPANYVDVELGFADEAAVNNFANIKLQAADTYGVWRMKRIAKFEADKNALLGV